MCLNISAIWCSHSLKCLSLQNISEVNNHFTSEKVSSTHITKMLFQDLLIADELDLERFETLLG